MDIQVLIENEDYIDLIDKAIFFQYKDSGIHSALLFIQRIFSVLCPVGRVMYSITIQTVMSQELASDEADYHSPLQHSYVDIVPKSIEALSLNGMDSAVLIVDNSSEGTGTSCRMRDSLVKYKSFLCACSHIVKKSKYYISLLSEEESAYTPELGILLYKMTRSLRAELEKGIDDVDSLDVLDVCSIEKSSLELLLVCKNMKKVIEVTQKVARTDATVLITGETGSGKEVLADFIHQFSKRSQGPLVKVNCGAIPEGLIEGLFFGHEKGAFTGALQNHIGYFEQADQGTLFLDEVGDLSPLAQIKLLRVLESFEVQRVGSIKKKKVDIRVIVATHKNLEEMIAQGLFREDLWYRLSVFPVAVPPLRWRRDDIPRLVKFFVNSIAKKLQLKSFPIIPKKEMDALLVYSFPGNIRELNHIVERAMIVASHVDGSIGNLRFEIKPSMASENMFAFLELEKLPPLAEISDKYVRFIIEITKGKIEGKKSASEILKVHPNTIRNKLEELNINMERKKGRPKKDS